MLSALVMLAVTSLKLTLLVLIVVPAVVVPIVLFGRRVRKLSRKSQDRVADVAAFAEEAINAIRTTQAYTHEPIDRKNFTAIVGETFNAARFRIRTRALLTAIVIMLTFSAVAVVLWVGGYDVIAGRMTGGELSAFVFYAILMAVSVGTVSEVIGDVQRAAGAAERLLELLGTEPDIAAPASPTPIPSPASGKVEFDAVTFHYPARPDKPSLHDFSLSVAPGETVALVGPSGAGKSTVLQLLLRFYDPEQGAIRFDGVDLKAADPSALRSQI